MSEKPHPLPTRAAGQRFYRELLRHEESRTAIRSRQILREYRVTGLDPLISRHAFWCLLEAPRR